MIAKNTVLIGAFREIEICVHTMKSSVTLVRTDSESVHIHDAFAKYCPDSGIRVSLYAPCLTEINGQAERYVAVVMNMTRVMLTTFGLSEKFWYVAVQHATCLKNHLPCSALDDRSHYFMVFGYNPDVSDLRIFKSPVHAFLPPREREGKLAYRARTGMYVGHDDYGSNALSLMIKRAAFLKRGRTHVFVCLDAAQQQMNKSPDISLNDESFIEYVGSRPELFSGINARGQLCKA